MMMRRIVISLCCFASAICTKEHVLANEVVERQVLQAQRDAEKKACSGTTKIRRIENWSTGLRVGTIEYIQAFSDKKGMAGFIQLSKAFDSGSTPLPEEGDDARSTLTIANRLYGAMLVKNPTGYAFDGPLMTFEKPSSGRSIIGTKDPYRFWAIEAFRTGFGCSLEELLASQYVSDVSVIDKDGQVTVSCKVNIPPNVELYSSEFEGTWSGTIDKSTGLFLSQRSTCEKFQLVIQIQQTAGNLSRVSTELQVFNKAKLKIMKSCEVLSNTSDTAGDLSSCYLTYYGLPEPPGLKIPSSGFSPILVLSIAIGSTTVAWFAWNRRMK